MISVVDYRALRFTGDGVADRDAVCYCPRYYILFWYISASFCSTLLPYLTFYIVLPWFLVTERWCIQHSADVVTFLPVFPIDVLHSHDYGDCPCSITKAHLFFVILMTFYPLIIRYLYGIPDIWLYSVLWWPIRIHWYRYYVTSHTGLLIHFRWPHPFDTHYSIYSNGIFCYSAWPDYLRCSYRFHYFISGGCCTCSDYDSHLPPLPDLFDTIVVCFVHALFHLRLRVHGTPLPPLCLIHYIVVGLPMEFMPLRFCCSLWLFITTDDSPHILPIYRNDRHHATVYRDDTGICIYSLFLGSILHATPCVLLLTSTVFWSWYSTFLMAVDS